MPDLTAAMNYILPGLWAFAEDHEISLSIEALHNQGCLMVSGSNVFTGKRLGFALTAASIEDGTYKAIFCVGLYKLAKLLKEPEPLTKETVLIGIAAIMASNPVVSRRLPMLWGHK